MTNRKANPKKAAKLSAEAEKRIADVDSMTLDQLDQLMFACMGDFTTGKITVEEANVLMRAAGKRIRAIKQELRQGSSS